MSNEYGTTDTAQPPEEQGPTGQTDFYVIIDYKKAHGVTVREMEDGDGDYDDCLVIPMLKNGIKSWGRDRYRVILAARRSHRDENASHVLVPQVEESVIKGMARQEYLGKYEHIAPIVGDIVPDITKIPHPPKFSPNSFSHVDMEMHVTNNPRGGATAVSFTEEPECQEVDGNGRRFLSEAQKRMRDAILKRKAGE